MYHLRGLDLHTFLQVVNMVLCMQLQIMNILKSNHNSWSQLYNFFPPPCIYQISPQIKLLCKLLVIKNVNLFHKIVMCVHAWRTPSFTNAALSCTNYVYLSTCFIQWWTFRPCALKYLHVQFVSDSVGISICYHF